MVGLSLIAFSLLFVVDRDAFDRAASEIHAHRSLGFILSALIVFYAFLRLQLFADAVPTAVWAGAVAAGLALLVGHRLLYRVIEFATARIGRPIVIGLAFALGVALAVYRI